MTIEWITSTQPVDYSEALTFMKDRVEKIIEGEADECIWLLEHPPVITAGTSANEKDLIDPERFPIFKAGRGGQYTYHGPGQRVIYVMLNLKKRRPDIRCFVHTLEEWVIQTLKDYNIHAERRDGRVGIWVKNQFGEDKIAAIGVRVRKWVTFHGIAINVNPDLSHFETIIPCGIKQTAQTPFGVTSFQKLNKDLSFDTLDSSLKNHFEKSFSEFFTNTNRTNCNIAR